MVRVAKLRDELTESLQNHIRRIYPVIQGPRAWGNLVEQREEYFNNKNRFPLVQEPLIEAIPQYKDGADSKPEDMPNWKYLESNKPFSKEDSARMKMLGSTLKIDDYLNFNLYPHQKESIIAHLEGRDVVVATGTGSGKTEAFLFPAVNHLLKEAIRCDGKKPSPRAVKVMVLYPMNALVADQMSRMRGLLGNPNVAMNIQNKGFGRFPQFGMYTGRTPFHGWYSSEEKDEQTGQVNWSREKTRKRMNKYIQPFLDSAKNPELWRQLRGKGKIPSIGGKVIFAPDSTPEAESLSFEQLPKPLQRIIADSKKEYRENKTLEEVRKSRYTILQDKEVFDRFRSADNSSGKIPDKLQYLGDGLDRELISRHQMHLGGVKKYIENKYPNADSSQVIEEMNIGIPDVMVTNYSMLEYMLMRPMEHVFWHKTTEWLRDSEDSKLLLVIDEAHLYEGAMGTEFSLLLNRLLSVLFPQEKDMDKARDRIQFIITSASLGGNASEARKYTAKLLSLNDERKSKVYLPQSQLRKFDLVPEEEKRVSNRDKNLMIESSNNINQGGKKLEVEIDFLQQLIGSRKFASASKQSMDLTSKFNEEIQRRDLIARSIENWPPAHRLRRLLLQCQSFKSDSIQSDHLSQAYKHEGVFQPNGNADRLPRRYGIIKQFLFEDPDTPDSNKALDFILDIIAAAHKFNDRRPFLPIRMHLFTRGDTKSRICPKCGTIWSDGIERCRKNNCNSLVYELMIDRNCGGAYVRLWWSSPGIRRITDHTKTPKLSEFDLPAQVWSSNNEGPSTSTNSDSYVGILAQVIDKDNDEVLSAPISNSTLFLLNVQNGSVMEYKSGLKDENLIIIRIFCPVKPQKKKIWEENQGWIDPRSCVYCSRRYLYQGNPYVSQFSDTETRGDQYFNELVSNCTSQLDPVANSRHAHKGRKMLIFSDGRQRAARLARDLKSQQSVDQGRAMFIHLHSQEWYKKIPEEFRALSNLYPYLCLMSAQVRTNPLSDTASKPSRSTMLDHTLLLMIYLENIYSSKIGPLESLKNDWKIINIELGFENFVKDQLKSAIYRDHRTWKNKMKTFNFGEDFKKRIKKDKLFKQIDNSRLGFNPDSWTYLVKEYDLFDDDTIQPILDIFKIPVYTKLKEDIDDIPVCEFKEVREKLDMLQLMSSMKKDTFIPFLRRDNIRDDNSISKIDLMEEISSKIIQLLIDDEINPNDFAKNCIKWTQQFQKDLTPNPPQELGDILLRWISDNRFGFMALGFGSLKIIDNFAPSDSKKIDFDWDIMKYAIPLLFLDKRELKVEKHSTSRAISSNRLSQNKERYTRFPSNKSKYSSYISNPCQSVSFDDFEKNFMRALMKAICGTKDVKKMKLNDQHPLYPTLRNSIPLVKDWLTLSNLSDPKKSILYTRGQRNEVHISADCLVFEPLEVKLRYNSLKNSVFCKNCLNRRPVSHVSLKISCVECNSFEIINNSTTDKLEKKRALDYLVERLKPWYQMATDFEKEGKTLAVYRAEEHTAQISEIANDEDGYTKTELHELMFMDIPIQTFQQESGVKHEQPPIDILSCTTTMEVGIDLGDLNAVALRTVPPHASNYQQRVGRAGRGSSEVSVALTWVDNSAYAQEFFITPERLVTNPDHPPYLYINNKKIRQRHLNAILFQKFFKRNPYDSDLLTFERMSPGANQLLESLGTLSDFINNVNDVYGIDKFIKYLNEIIDETDLDENNRIMNISRSSDIELKDWTVKLLNKVNKWYDLKVTEEEE